MTSRQLSFYSHHDIPGLDSTRGFFLGAGMTEVSDPEDADIIIFNGGEDVGTELYNEKPVSRGIPHKMSYRDHEEASLFDDYAGRRLLLGICRGSQILNCLNGGTLWQHVDGHGGSHPILDLRTGKMHMATSTHHQQMRPNLDAGKVICVASRSHHKQADGISLEFAPTQVPDKGSEDVEVVWYPNTNSLCIQGHPEYVPGTEFANYCLELIEECLDECEMNREVA